MTDNDYTAAAFLEKYEILEAPEGETWTKDQLERHDIPLQQTWLIVDESWIIMAALEVTAEGSYIVTSEPWTSSLENYAWSPA